MSAEEQKDRYVRAVERLRELHRPSFEMGGKRYTQRVTVAEDEMTPEFRIRHQCVTEDEAAATWDEPCIPGEEHQVEACSECRTSIPDAETAYFVWPCPTIRILDEERI